ncbi:putative mitochondrial protein [Andalucia godoyi]|uniref:Putative mitochondrial protein n=1 Tax=Andalucia godoyi TaxID=505711 RepID=A0A8K0AIY8_ANDGO|nr:putative mitochondrial protein [Andalucia godoyi]|eukprot:ANDGO_07422.mRNA.1 putative mitochondrial protein
MLHRTAPLSRPMDNWTIWTSIQRLWSLDFAVQRLLLQKLFPPNKLSEMKAEQAALERLAPIQWGKFSQWVPALIHHAQDGYGVLCTSPIGQPLPLASAFKKGTERLRCCQELIVQLCSIIIVAHTRSGGSSFHDKENAGFQYHLAFSPSWLQRYDREKKKLKDNVGLCASLQQMVLTAFFIAFGVYFSWLPPKICTLHYEDDKIGKSRHTSLSNVDQLPTERTKLIDKLLDENFTATHCIGSIAQMLTDRKPLLDMFRALREDCPWLFVLNAVHPRVNQRLLVERIVRACHVHHDVTADYSLVDGVDIPSSEDGRQ